MKAEDKFVQFYSLGQFKLYHLYDGYCKFDAGSAFGIVPKVIWSKLVTPDENNFINIRVSPLLIQTKETNILIETGFGTKHRENEKIKKVWTIFQEKTLLDCLTEIGLAPKDIHIVVLTHLHFDHAGGSTILNDMGEVVPTFPNATYYVPKEDWDIGLNPHILGKNSYYPENYFPLQEKGLLKLIDGDTTIFQGIQFIPVGGHVKSYGLVQINSEIGTALFLGDFASTIHHIKPTWNPAFDLDPLTSSLMKKSYFQKAIDNHWLLIFYHDMNIALAYLNDNWKVEPVLEIKP